VRFDLPTADAETEPFWEAARSEQLLVRRCNDCGKAHFYPRRFCPSCWSSDVEWETAGGGATLYTWSVVHSNDLPPFRERLPYVAAVVDLDEGPRMMTNIVDCEPDALTIGMRLAVAFEARTDDVTVPVFRPA
jgi:uncharacterized OB-fold protein